MDSFIVEIQEALERSGYNPGPIDGICGIKTRAAIIAFQEDHGLLADGLVGVLTQAALLGENNRIEDKNSDQLTKHFNREEFRCCCSGLYCNGFPAEMHQSLLRKLEATRLDLNSEIIITSGVRCIRRNSEVGGIPESRHLSGRAVDCYAPGFSIYTLAEIGERNGFRVLIYHEQGFCHMEI